jgi:hypothetical protein
MLACGITLLGPIDAAPASSMQVARGSSSASGPGQPLRYTVEVERGIGESSATVARQIEDRIADHRGWGAGFRRSFQRVSRGRHDVRIVLVSATTTQRMCLPMNVVRYWNCYRGGVVVLNHDRWLRPAPTYGPGRVPEYRTLMIMHELGHALGHGHAGCTAGRLAPPMMAQGKGLRGCLRNPWPEPKARRLASRCRVDATRIRNTRFVRVTGVAAHVGTPVVLRLQQRADAAWKSLRAVRTSSMSAAVWVVPTQARFVRVSMPGTASRRACSAVARVASGARS